MVAKFLIQHGLVAAAVLSPTVTASTWSQAATPHCGELHGLLGDKVLFPGDEAYEASIGSYFSAQESAVRPLCVVAPTTTDDVAKTVVVLTKPSSTGQKPIFAIRSGGHMSNAGAANAEGGVTIDLQAMNAVTVSDDGAVVSVGAGARWRDVYKALDPLGLTAAGGRVAQVGVGGFTTGGGISFHSPRYGWGCDTVVNYQVVLADGSVVDANAHNENADLLVALRGGSNNLGVVTRIDYRTIEQGNLLGGSVIHTLDTASQQLSALDGLTNADDYDEYASVITSFSYSPEMSPGLISNSLIYTKPVENPAALAPFLEIPSVQSTMRISNMSDFTAEIGAFNPNGLRELYASITHVASSAMLDVVYQGWRNSTESIKDVPGVLYSISMEPLPRDIYGHAPDDNMLGLGNRTLPLMVTNLSVSWNRTQDDALVEQTARDMEAAIEVEGEKIGGNDPFRYVNYAAWWDDPIATYGEESVERLRAVQRRVDPGKVFTYQVPGGFKVPKGGEGKE